MPTIAIVLVAIVVLGFLVLRSTIKIVQEYERGVIFPLVVSSEHVDQACSS
jgi:hypothetical protein